MAIKEPSFRFGCGRYLEESGAIALAGREARRFGRSALVIGGERALAVAGEALFASLSEAEIAYTAVTHAGSCNRPDAERLIDSARQCDLVIGVGGGVIMDFAKLVAVLTERPILNIPTSAATCAAFTPLSVCYTEAGETVGTAHHDREVDGVIVDSEIMLTQPPRLFIAGIFDALAKYTELNHRYGNEGMTNSPLGLDYAYHLAVQSAAVIYEKSDEALAALRERRVTPAFEEMLFTLIPITGLVSSVARGSNQTALAHKFYEAARRMHPIETKPYLHGELVGVGLLLQNLYNRTEGENERLTSLMARYRLPSCPSECGLSAGEETKEQYLSALLNTSAMQECGEPERLKAAMDEFWK